MRIFRRILNIQAPKKLLLFESKSFSTSSEFRQALIGRLQRNVKSITPFGYFILAIPVTTFGLGSWQIQRKQWKENLVAELKQRTSSPPVNLPDNLDDLKTLEYCPVQVRGTFLHDKELYMGPKSLIRHGDSVTQGSLFSKQQDSTTGYLVITPFKLAGRDDTILVNRGWVPAKNKDPQTRHDGQVKEEIDLVGIVRLHENRPQFMPKNKDNCFYYRDLEAMAQLTGASPIYLDATRDSFGGPIAGQTRVTLRNEHLSYIITWFSLSAITSFYWIKNFLLIK